MARLACLTLLCALAACGSATRPFNDANNGSDGGVPDSNPGDIDAMPQTAATPSREIVNGAGRMSGATYTFDVEIGQPISQQPTTGATYTLEGNAAVRP